MFACRRLIPFQHPGTLCEAEGRVLFPSLGFKKYVYLLYSMDFRLSMGKTTCSPVLMSGFFVKTGKKRFPRPAGNR
jgi:hypothetical protein